MTFRFATAIAAFAALTACAGDVDTTADTAAGAVGATAAATTPDADRLDDRVEVALSTDSTLRFFGLDADEDDGKVVLKGVVRTEEQKMAASTVAQRVATGVSVENRIRVDANARMSETEPVDVDDVEEQIEKAFEDDATLNPLDIDVDEENGQIILEGTVRSADQRTMAETVAKRIAGTVVIANRIRVQ